MIHEFRKPIPGDVTDSGSWENDFWCVVLREGGVVRHYRSDQIRIAASGTLGIEK